jgi:transcriptional regulator with XRE-family HTH domain
MARQYVHDIADALARSGGKPQTLRGYRKEQGITQQELAEMTGLSRTYLSEIERGAAQNVSLHVARKIAAVMDCPLSAIQIPQQAD